MKKLHPKQRLILALVLSFLLCFHMNADAYQLMSTNFYIIGTNGLPTLKDGNMTIYDTPYSNGVDWEDGVKMNNGGENFGITRLGANLAVERRQLVTGADTAYFNMWGMVVRNYRFEVTMENFNSFTQTAYVWDNYLHSVQPVDFTGLTTVNFSVTTDAASKAAGRFKVIYTTPAQYNVMLSSMFSALPVTITSVQAVKKNKFNLVSWQVENELSMQDYVVEHSTDGRNFVALGRVNAINRTTKHQYQFEDAAGIAADYYRIRANSNDSKSSYSKTVIVKGDNANASVVIFPNPVANKQVHLKLTDGLTGAYEITLVYPNGKMVSLKSLSLVSGQSEAVVALPASVAAGIYQLRFASGDQSVITKSVVVL